MTEESAAERIAWARAQFDIDDAYLNSATFGLPPKASTEALDAAMVEWRAGRTNPVDYDLPLERSRDLFAGLVGVRPAQVATGSQTSQFVGLVAAALPDGAEVLTPEGEFTSVTFPFHAQGDRLRVREVPLAGLADAVTSSTHLVATAAVQSSDGRVADLDAIVARCAENGTQSLVDATQAVGWLPVDASRFSYVVCSGYKWLLAARGTAFFVVSDDAAPHLVPAAAGWYAGTDPWQSIYGTPLRLAATAKRFDLSPAWLSWVSQPESLELLARVGVDELHANALALAARFCEGVDIPVQRSAIVSIGIDEHAPGNLAAAGVRAAMRAGRLRVSFHISTTEAHVDRAVEALRGHVSA